VDKEVLTVPSAYGVIPLHLQYMPEAIGYDVQAHDANNTLAISAIATHIDYGYSTDGDK
jgi:hypothetical protein